MKYFTRCKDQSHLLWVTRTKSITIFSTSWHHRSQDYQGAWRRVLVKVTVQPAQLCCDCWTSAGPVLILVLVSQTGKYRCVFIRNAHWLCCIVTYKLCCIVTAWVLGYMTMGSPPQHAPATTRNISNVISVLRCLVSHQNWIRPCIQEDFFLRLW